MRMYDLILKKRNGFPHTRAEIEYIVGGYTKGEIPDYQMSAWLMCVYYKGMSRDETVWLTKAMADSGDRLSLDRIEGIKVDKHSTGGVGDKTTLIVAPILASLGVPIAKMSGRGLGHTGGTIDKLESIKGFRTDISEEEFINNVNTHKLALAGQTGSLAPADKKIYALRDVTATVDSLPLIASSIMSKKLAAGADVIVLDVKCGTGAFMKNIEDARALAHTMVDIGNAAGRKTCAVITDMNEPLGCMVGNALEVKEAVSVLGIRDFNDAGYKNVGRLIEVSLTLAAYMLMGAGKAAGIAEARERCENALLSGRALDKLAEFVRAQGGDEGMIYDASRLLKARYIVPVYLPTSGYITGCMANEVGMVNLILGGGREKKDSVIDLAVGIDIRKHIGDYVDKNEPFAYIHADSEEVIPEAKRRLIASYAVGNVRQEALSAVREVIM